MVNMFIKESGLGPFSAAAISELNMPTTAL